MRVLCINPGSTSTRIAVFEKQERECYVNIPHSAEKLESFPTVQDQLDYRLGLVEKFMAENGIDLSSVDAVVGRGGALRPMEGGIFTVNEAMLEDCRNAVYAEHPANLGCQIAKKLADQKGLPCFVVDPPLMDEFEEASRFSGFAPIKRESAFHALNEKMVARFIAERLGRPLEELNLVTVHMGSGVSVTAHHKGRCSDNTFGSGGDGPFSPERAGRMPVLELAKMMSEEPDWRQRPWKKMFSKESGFRSYLGTNNVIEIEKMSDAGDGLAGDLIDGLAYMISKEIAAYAAGLDWEVDAIGITGAIANSRRLVRTIQEHTAFIAESFAFPGEYEMEGLASGGLRALRGETTKEY